MTKKRTLRVLWKQYFWWAVVAMIATLIIGAGMLRADSLPEVQELKGINLYQHALLLQQQAFQAQQQFQVASKAYHDWEVETVKANKFPEGTTLAPNLDTQKVAVNIPAKPEKPTEKK